jgi:MFS family permease
METYLQYRRIGKALRLQLTKVNARTACDLPCLSQQQTRTIRDREVRVIGWDAPFDPLNPRNWPFSKRLRATLVVCALGCLQSVASALDSAVVPQAARDLGVSDVVESFGAIGSYLLGFGSGVLLAGPISEVVGRNIVYLTSLVLMCVFLMASALAPNIGAQIVFRFLASTAGAAPSVCAGGSIVDMFDALEKSYMLPLFSLFGFGGAALGPVMGAWIAESPILHTWRWAEWFTLMFAAITLVTTFLFQPETYAPVLLSWKARQLRTISGDDRYFAAHEIERVPLTSRLKTALKRPLIMAFHEPIILLISAYLSLVFIILFTFLSGYDYIFRRTYNISQGLTNTLFIAIVIGVVLSYATTPWIYRHTLRAQQLAKINGHSQFSPEIRLWYAMLGAPALPISLFWLAWTSYPSISIWVPLSATVFFGYAAVLIFTTTYMYLIDSYESVAASALVFATVSRYVVSAGMVTASIPFYENVGHHWTVTILGCFSLLLTPIPYVFYKYGDRIRRKSRFAVTSEESPLKDARGQEGTLRANAMSGGLEAGEAKAKKECEV